MIGIFTLPTLPKPNESRTCKTLLCFMSLLRSSDLARHLLVILFCHVAKLISTLGSIILNAVYHNAPTDFESQYKLDGLNLSLFSLFENYIVSIVERLILEIVFFVPLFDLHR
jgi:hypothetical protein